MTARTHTLAVHAGGIGDLLLALPALRHLASQGPLAGLGRPRRLELAVAAGVLESAYDLEEVGFESAFTRPNERLESFLEPYRRVVLWMRDDGALERSIRACGVPEVSAFPGLPPDGWTDHASEYYLQCVGGEAGLDARLALDPAGRSYDVVIHPGSGGIRKNWPLDHFEELARALSGRGRAVTWCLGPAEEGMPAPPDAPLLHAESLVELARSLAGARLYIGNDSGVSHLAAAVGCPTVVLFGPTDPRVWAPRGGHVTVVRGMPWPEVGQVLEALGS